MENLYVNDADKGKIFSALSLGSEEVRGELFHVNGDHFLLVDGTYAIKVIPSTIKEVNGENETRTFSDEIRKLSEDSMGKLVEEYYQKTLDDIKDRASKGYTVSHVSVPNTIAPKLVSLLSREGFASGLIVRGDLSDILIKW